MTHFFVDWAIWQKLVFILACAIIVTVLLGCAKLGHTHVKLQKYVALAEKEKQEQELRRQMTQPRDAARAEGGNEDVPFGSRALESGSPVDGIWYSRSNTPEPPSEVNSKASSIWSHVPRKDFDIDLEKQEAIFSHNRSSSQSMAGSGHHSSFTMGAARPAVAPSHQRSRHSSPDMAMAKPPKSRHPPPSLSKFIGTPYLYRQDSTTSTLNALDSIYQASGPLADHEGADTLDSTYSSNQSSSESTDNDPIAASAPKLLNQQSRSRFNSTDLELMHSHRISQAAEIGQLTPRVRKASIADEWASIAVAGYMTCTPDPQDQNVEQSRFAEKISPELRGEPYSEISIPKIDTLPPAVRMSSVPDVTSFARFCQTAPSSPQRSDRGSLSAEGDQLSPFQSSLPLQSASVSSGPSKGVISADGPISTAPEQPQVNLNQSDPNRTSFEHRVPAVIRGLGSGFEILAPGTFSPSIPANYPVEKHKQAPPISMHNSSSLPRSSSAGSGRKLQKKRRQSVDSCTSDSSWRSRASVT